jgi:hypothetical protein
VNPGTEPTLVAPCAPPPPPPDEPAVDPPPPPAEPPQPPFELQPPRFKPQLPPSVLVASPDVRSDAMPHAAWLSPPTSPNLDSSPLPASRVDAAAAAPYAAAVLVGTYSANHPIAASTPTPVESEAEEPQAAAVVVPQSAPNFAELRGSIRHPPGEASARAKKRARGSVQNANGGAHKQPAKIGRSKPEAWECDISLPAL